MDQRMKFLVEWQHGLEAKAELCRRYGIARSVGYKWAQRYQRQGPAGLQDRSRAPHHHPNQTPLDVVTRILELRYAHRLWGAPKIRALLLRQHPDQPCPSQSTIGEILRSAGLTRPRARRRRTPPHTQPLAHAAAPHDVVSIDFKGWFRCGDGSRVDPLTVVDNASRYVLCCQAVDGCDYPHVRAVMETVFREHGLPRAIGSDNGPPFATRALGGLSRLSLWWTKLGIQVERIRPARPSENGRQERFHLTLKQHTANPPARNRRAQQRRFRSFCREYNEQRPHQALQQDPPASVYQRSPRPYPQRLPEIEYEQAWVERKVQRSGYVYWRGQEVFTHGGSGTQRVMRITSPRGFRNQPFLVFLQPAGSERKTAQTPLPGLESFGHAYPRLAPWATFKRPLRGLGFSVADKLTDGLGSRVADPVDWSRSGRSWPNKLT